MRADVGGWQENKAQPARPEHDVCLFVYVNSPKVAMAGPCASGVSIQCTAAPKLITKAHKSGQLRELARHSCKNLSPSSRRPLAF